MSSISFPPRSLSFGPVFTDRDLVKLQTLENCCGIAEREAKEGKEIVFFRMLEKMETFDIIPRLKHFLAELPESTRLKNLSQKFQCLQLLVEYKLQKNLLKFRNLVTEASQTDDPILLQEILKKINALRLPEKLRCSNRKTLKNPEDQILQIVQRMDLLEHLKRAKRTRTKPLPPPPCKELKGSRKYIELILENAQNKKTEWSIPKRRICNFSVKDDSFGQIDKVQGIVFMEDKDILKIHSMYFLSPSPFIGKIDEEILEVRDRCFLNLSPFYRDFHAQILKFCRESGHLSAKAYSPEFNEATKKWFHELKDDHPQWEKTFTDLYKKLHAIGLTASGHHVILQQASNSCMATCVAMLALDHGKIPNYASICEGLGNNEKQIAWMEEAGLTPYLTELPRTQQEKTIEILDQCLKERGPGMLNIIDKDLGAHEIILDAISIENQTAEIRDPFHGWAVTIPLEKLVSISNTSAPPIFKQVSTLKI